MMVYLQLKSGPEDGIPTFWEWGCNIIYEQSVSLPAPEAQGISVYWGRGGMKLTIHHHLVLRLRMCGALQLYL
jgi:hypothetical protein